MDCVRIQSQGPPGGVCYYLGNMMSSFRHFEINVSQSDFFVVRNRDRCLVNIRNLVFHVRHVRDRVDPNWKEKLKQVSSVFRIFDQQYSTVCHVNAPLIRFRCVLVCPELNTWQDMKMMSVMNHTFFRSRQVIENGSMPQVLKRQDLLRWSLREAPALPLPRMSMADARKWTVILKTIAMTKSRAHRELGNLR